MADGWAAELGISMEDICQSGPVIPVVEIDDAKLAVPLTETLLRGGIREIEITLRTPQALDSIRAVADGSEIRVGAGTLLSAKDVMQAKEAGASFGVSPGSSDDLINVSKQENFPLLPGAVSPTEVMRLRDRGYNLQKFFPAEASGGVAMLKSLSGPVPDIRFCPTGGVSLSNAKDYLSLPNVVCVGGSWIAPRQLIAEQAWDEIEANARQSITLLRT